MTTPPFSGLRVVLVAAFNRRYHRTGLALAAALESLGCEVRRCEERRRGWTAVIPRPLAARLAARLTRPRADVVLVFKGAMLAPEETRALKARFGGRWVNWFPDDPHQLAVSTRLAPAFDWFFTHDSSSVASHCRAGARAAYLAFGCDPGFLRRPLAPLGRWEAPLAFVGSRDPARERVVGELADLGLATWGPGWPNGPVYGKAFVHALAGATVGLNIHQQFGAADPARYGTGANMRVFELAAVGTPQLVDAKSDIARHFTAGRELIVYRSVGELREHARALLDDARLRQSLAAAARERAVREHTWAQRLEELLTVALR